MGDGGQRLPPLIDQHAQGQKRGAADPVLAMDQHLVAALDMAASEAHAPLEDVHAGGFGVGGR